MGWAASGGSHGRSPFSTSHLGVGVIGSDPSNFAAESAIDSAAKFTVDVTQFHVAILRSHGPRESQKKWLDSAEGK